MSLILIFAAMSQTFNLPTGLLSALCYVESGHHVTSINLTDHGSSSIGLCQLKFNTAKYLGYRGNAAQLQRDATINAYYAGKYLRMQLDRYHGDTRKAVAAYNAGRYRMKGRFAMNQHYVDKVFRAWGENR